MLGLIASLSAHIACAGAVLQTPQGDGAFVYTNSLGVRIEVLGACKVNESDVVAWDVAGLRSLSLRQKVIDQAISNGGCSFEFDYPGKTRYVIFSVSGPKLLGFRLWNINQPNRRMMGCRFGSCLAGQLFLLPVHCQSDDAATSLGLQAASALNQLGVLKPKAGPAPTKDASKVSLTYIERFTGRSVRNGFGYEWPLLASNNMAWSLFFTVPAKPENENLFFTISGKTIGTPLYVDISGKPTGAAPDIKVLNRLCLYNQDPDPLTYSNYARQEIIRTDLGTYVLATNINPKYIKDITISRIIYDYTTFANIPLDPKE